MNLTNNAVSFMGKHQFLVSQSTSGLLYRVICAEMSKYPVQFDPDLNTKGPIPGITGTGQKGILYQATLIWNPADDKFFKEIISNVENQIEEYGNVSLQTQRVKRSFSLKRMFKKGFNPKNTYRSFKRFMASILP